MTQNGNNQPKTQHPVRTLPSTLIEFAGTEQARKRLGLEKPLVLQELEKLSEFNGLTFADLPDSFQLQFSTRPSR